MTTTRTTADARPLTHGSVISWDMPRNYSVQYDTILSALAGAGFDHTYCREMQPRNAFARAAHTLAEERIIRKVNEDGAEMRFQFTAEVKGADGKDLIYSKEAVLVLDKKSGAVRAETAGPVSAQLVAAATAAISSQVGRRGAADMTRIIDRLFTRNADLFLTRASGGCYFCPRHHDAFLDRVQAFLDAVGVTLIRFPVLAGTAHGDRTVTETVREGLSRMLRQHVEAVDAFAPDTRDGTIQAMVDRINQTRLKAEAYAEFLGDQKAALDEQLADARAILREKVAALGRNQDVPEPGDAGVPEFETAAA